MNTETAMLNLQARMRLVGKSSQEMQHCLAQMRVIFSSASQPLPKPPGVQWDDLVGMPLSPEWRLYDEWVCKKHELPVLRHPYSNQIWMCFLGGMAYYDKRDMYRFVENPANRRSVQRGEAAPV